MLLSAAIPGAEAAGLLLGRRYAALGWRNVGWRGMLNAQLRSAVGGGVVLPRVSAATPASPEAMVNLAAMPRLGGYAARAGAFALMT